MKIAIVGSGIAGLVTAYHLGREHEVTVFEANDYVGGHTHTVDVAAGDRNFAVDTGFIVFNDWTYPNFIDLMDELGVESQASDMSFSVRCERSGLEYNGSSLNSLFAQRRNLLRPSFYRMLRDILRFNAQAPAMLEADEDDMTLGEYLHNNGYSRAFVDQYIVPMGAAIWSAEPAQMHLCPARFFIRFFQNHGLLSVNDRPQWRVIRGGSRAYLGKLTESFRDRIRLAAPVIGIRRHTTHVDVVTAAAGRERFDQVFLACHSDQALRLLTDPRPAEHDVLQAIPYQANDVILHTDESLLPRRRRAWAAWNYHVLPHATGTVAVTYNMNILQSLDAPQTFCVTLNNTDAIDARRIIARYRYDHPVFTTGGVAAQQRQAEINGANRTYFCGAYWRNGFHEDGVVSALAAVEHFNERYGNEQLYLRRAG